jgi:hypothetical protein
MRFCPSCGQDFNAVPVVDAGQGGTETATNANPAGPKDQPNLAEAPGARRPWLLLGVVIFVAVVAAGAFLALAGSGAFVPHHTVAGTFTLTDTDTDPSITTIANGCEGTGGYSDIRPGAGVTLKDGDGKVLATSFLDSGSGTANSCSFTFSLANVPEAPFYTVEISHRGQLSYSLSDMKAQDWSLSLTLGN